MGNQLDICEICGADLKYIETASDYECYFCGEIKKTSIVCSKGHYICDGCHSKGAIDVIKDFCKKTDLTDPFEIADEIMKHPNFKMYGPEHHILVPVSILTSLKNLKIKKPDGTYVEYKDILNAIQRASKVPGGWCGFYGTCGAGIGSGIALSIFTGATPATNKYRTLANKTTSRSLSRIADNLEHCCKRSVRISIAEAIKILNEYFNLGLDYNPRKCDFTDINDKCERVNCPIF
ncbi:MAG: radical SAM protein [Candidatus Lokiarchaeota archaeon]|nr:radical SAM protein [Candidatus Lokiarchaeota archaeon]